MTKYKCIIFDCDGVLVDSESIAIGTLVEMANNLGADLDLKASMVSLKGKSFNSCLEMISQRIGKPLPDTFEKEYRANTFKAFKETIQPIEGVKEVLENLDLPFCVASSGPENKIRLNLELTGLLPFFENKIFSCYTIQKWKPDPAVYIWAAQTMGFNPEECLVIEDSISGVLAAKNGGFDVFGFTVHDYNNELESACTATFPSMDKLLDMI